MKRRSFILSTIVLGGLTLWGAVAQAAELVYVSAQGCPYCRLWDAKVGPVYPKSAEGKRAPLRAVDISDVAGTGLKIDRPVRYTPTFILIENSREVGRIEGYPGEDFFWGMLGRLLEKLPVEQGEPAAVSAGG